MPHRDAGGPLGPGVRVAGPLDPPHLAAISTGAFCDHWSRQPDQICGILPPITERLVGLSAIGCRQGGGEISVDPRRRERPAGQGGPFES